VGESPLEGLPVRVTAGAGALDSDLVKAAASTRSACSRQGAGETST